MAKNENNFKQKVKKVLKKSGKKIIMAVLPVILIIVLLAGAVYFITIDDGLYKEGDWGSTNYAASQYINGVTVGDGGNLSGSMSAQELWEKMIKNGSRVNEYLKSPKELARLMRAEIVTQYPDTREDPDKDIDWDEIAKDPDKMQGIIKFKRADSSNKKTTMKYASPEEFQSYIDEYNSSGSEKAKQNALTHFTLKKSSTATASGNGGAVAAGDGVMTDVSQAIIDATNRTSWPGANYCAKWVDDVYTNAGLSVNRQGTAFAEALLNVISTDKSAIPIGAAVYGTGQASGGAGHVGIYIGSGRVIDSVSSGIKTWDSIDSWLSWQTDSIGGYQGWIGWGWADGNKTRGTTEDPNVTQKNNSSKNNNDNSKTTNEKAVEKTVSGDGYSKEYTSSAGITYKEYKQIEGSYKDNSYWDRTIYWSGCGPTSVTILASGLLNSSSTPGDIAAEMNSKYGETSYNTLKAEMDSLGMQSEVTMNPSASIIQDNLRNGKVMLVSVNSNTKYTSISHIMAIVDINSEGEVYILNPASNSDTLNGWTDISEITKGCQYIVTTEAGAAGIANSTNDSNYVAVVATWNEVDTTVKSDDPNVKEYSTSEYTMTTTPINYQEMVKPYAVPFDLLWAFLVVGEDKKFAFDFADLIYNSDIQITVYDNTTVNTDVNNWVYTQETKTDVDLTIRASYYDSVHGKTYTKLDSMMDHVHDPYKESQYNTIKTVVTTTNTINSVLTRANVWCVDYKNDYVYQSPSQSGGESTTATQADQEYSTEPNYTESSSNGNVSYSCEHVNQKKQELRNKVLDEYLDNVKVKLPDAPSNIGDKSDVENSLPPLRPDDSSVAVSETYHNIKYYQRYVNISDTVTNTISTQKYTKGTPEIKEKTTKEDEPNFVTLFKKKKYRQNKKNITSASSWLFEIIESNDSTKEMLDLIKYLLYKATGTNYGIKEFDFNNFFASKTLVTVGAGDYIVNIDMCDPNLVITDLNKLKTAFSWYSNDSVLQQYASYFLECQEKYRVNAIFAAAVSITESSAGTNVAIGGNNMFSISNGGQGNWNQYGSMNSSIEAFFKLISTEYFTNEQYSVDSISRGNPEGSHCYCVPPDDWINNTCSYMTSMFNEVGISTTTDNITDKGAAIVEAAKEKLGCKYVYGAEGPNEFDCSGLTMWCYKKVGIDLPHNDVSQKNKAINIVSVSSARVGDVLWTQGHVAIYIGNGQCIEAPNENDVVKISNISGRFTYALQFY